jgi:predicted Zn-dependent protease
MSTTIQPFERALTGGLAAVVTLTLAACGKEPASRPAPSGSAAVAPGPPMPEPETTVEPAAIEAALDAALHYAEADRLGEAEAILETLVRKAPETIDGRTMYAEILLMLAQREPDPARAAVRIEAAYEQYAAAAEQSEADASVHHAAGVVAHQLGRVDAALEHYVQARTLDPGNAQTWLYEAQCHMARRDWGQATLAASWVLKIDPDEPWAIASLAEIELEQNRLNLALDKIREARAINPDEIAFRVKEAKILRRANRPEEALEVLVNLPQADRATEAVAHEIATARSMRGDHDEAAAAWALCFERNPASWRAALRTADALRRAGRLAEATSFHAEASRIAPEEPEVVGWGRAEAGGE